MVVYLCHVSIIRAHNWYLVQILASYDLCVAFAAHGMVWQGTSQANIGGVTTVVIPWFFWTKFSCLDFNTFTWACQHQSGWIQFRQINLTVHSHGYLQLPWVIPFFICRLICRMGRCHSWSTTSSEAEWGNWKTRFVSRWNVRMRLFFIFYVR